MKYDIEKIKWLICFRDEKDKLFTRTYGKEINWYISEEEAKREGLAGIFSLAQLVKDTGIMKEKAPTLSSIDVGSFRFSLKEIVDYAFSPDAQIGNEIYATPAQDALPFIAEIFPAFRR